MDGHYRHTLEIYKDTSSSGIRLQASVLKGEMARTPVWTAFINYKISSRQWMKRPEKHKIYLGDLPRYIFLADYKPYFGPNGEHELHFEKVKGDVVSILAFIHFTDLSIQMPTNLN